MTNVRSAADLMEDAADMISGGKETKPAGIGSTYDSAKFAMNSAGKSIQKIGDLISEAMKFVATLEAIAQLPADQQKVFMEMEDGYYFWQVQDAVGELVDFEDHIKSGVEKLGEAITSVRAAGKGLDEFKRR